MWSPQNIDVGSYEACDTVAIKMLTYETCGTPAPRELLYN